MWNSRLQKVYSQGFGLALLLGLLVFLGGCGREQAASTSAALTTVGATTAPRVSYTDPRNGFVCEPINRKLTIGFTKAMDPLTINTSTFTVTGPSAVAGTVTLDAANNIAMFTPNSPGLSAGVTYTATITNSAKDTTGTPLASTYVWTFTSCASADSTAPTMIFTVPANAAAAVPINQKITATFSEGMDSTTLTGTTFTVTGPGATAVSGTVSYAGNAGAVATFTPTNNLAANTLFTATVTSGAKDLAGVALAGGGLVPNPWTFTTSAVADTAAPTVTVTVPANTATNVPLNQAVNATFSKDMDPLTITTDTFKVAAGAATPLTGTVSYVASTRVATFVPQSNLAANTTYTATISNGSAGVKDATGNALGSGAAPNPWTFTTGAAAGPVGPNLGAASTFGDFGGGAGVTNQGINTVINGDIGTTGASTLVTGFHDLGTGCTYTETGSNIGTVNGKIYTNAPPPTVGCPSEGTAVTFAIATQAATDALAAFNNLSPAQRPGGTDPGAGQLGGLVLAPGIYKSASGGFLITGSDLTLNGQGDSNALWVFQMASSLTVGAAGLPRSIILTNGAQAKNVFWQVGSAATINPAGGGTMVGTIIASASISFSTAGNVAIATLNGRALALNASVTMVNTVINVPAP